MTPETPLERLQRWYLSQCDDDWEHQQGVRIDTLDNPGWSVEVDLYLTDLENASFEPLRIERSEQDWIQARVEEFKWKAFCGPLNLGEGIAVFLDWAKCD
jgi:Immunity protein 53